jgi:hypothetical protein
VTKQPLTSDDMVPHRVTYSLPDIPSKTISAAYMTTEDRHPDMIAFHDYEHKTVALVRRDTVLHVERVQAGGDHG